MIAAMPVKTKDEKIQIRIELADLARWRATADAEGLTLSNWIRKTCNANAVDQETIDAVEAKLRAEKSRKRGGR